MATTSPQSAGPPSVDRLKPNAIGLVGVIFMAIATAAPITAMTGNVPVAVGFGNGVGAPAGYIFATVVLSIFAAGYVAMARHITAAGAFYGYISHGLGRVMGMASGLLAVMAYIVFEASLIGIFSYFAQTTFESQLHVDIPWQVFAGAMLVINATLAYFDVNLAAKVLAVLLITEISVLAIMAVAVLVSGGGPDGIPLDPINPVNGFEGVSPGLGLFFAFWSWVGFESTAMYGEESKNPKKIIPRATLISVTAVGVFYVFVSWMAIAGNGLQESVRVAQEDALGLFFNPTESFVGQGAVDVFQWLLITGSFACGFAFHNCASRYLYAIGREGFIDRRLGRTHPQHGSPYVASFTQTVIATAIVALFWIFGQDPYLSLYVLMALLGTMAILIVQTLCSLAVLGYFRRVHPHSEHHHWFRTTVAPILGAIGMGAVVVLLLTNLDAAAGPASETVFFELIPWIVIGLFVAGVALALYMRAKRPDRYEIIGRVVYADTQERPVSDAALPGGAEDLLDGNASAATVVTRP